MNVSYRTFQNDDIEELLSLMLELGYAIERNQFQATIKELQRRGDVIFVAETEGKVIGSVSVIIDVRLAEGISGEIASLVVLENYRGKGIGTDLIRLAEDHLQQHVKTNRIRANTIRKNSHSYYKSLGYEEIKEQKVFLKNLPPVTQAVE